MKLEREEKEKRKNERRLNKYNETHKTIDGIIYKFCSLHNEYFPHEDNWFVGSEEYFYKNKSNLIDGLHPYCKKCNNKKSFKWIKDNYEQFKQTRKNGYFQTQKYKDWEKQHSINMRPYNKEYIKSHPEKSRMYNEKRSKKEHEISKIEWQNCKEYFNNQCAYCGLSLDEHYYTYKGITKLGDFHREHVQIDGANDLSNCVSSCESCNSQKWKFDMLSWYKQQSFYSEERLEKIVKWLTEDYKQFYIEKIKLPYDIVRKRNEDGRTYHYELWSVDENNKNTEVVMSKDKKKELKPYIDDIMKLHI